MKRMVFVLVLLLSGALHAQSDVSSGAIRLRLEKLRTTGSVLYIAAHPDDENSAVLAYMANRAKVRAGYLSLTRGDGGQNLIGHEQAELLGVIRTQELLAARRSDGGEQFFTRAYDFGYSKSPDETFRVWNHDSILADVVWVIRSFRPDVIITRFPTNGDGGHGHHTASAILALEAFKAAADSTMFPGQLSLVQTWQARRIFWNAWPGALRRRGANLERLIRINTGEFNPLLGMSYTEIAARSRAKHKSQGFGSTAVRTDNWEYFELMDGDSARTDVFDGIPMDWSDIPGGRQMVGLIDTLIRSFDVHRPAASVPGLVRLRRLMKSLPSSDRIEIKIREVDDLIRSCAGLWVESVAADHSVVPGSSVRVSATAILRNDASVTLKYLLWPGLREDGLGTDTLRVDRPMTKGQAVRLDSLIHFSPATATTSPFWLSQKPDGRFTLPDQTLVGPAENAPARTVVFVFDIDDSEWAVPSPVWYRWTDRVDGEKLRALEILPPVTIQFTEKTFLFPDNAPRTLSLKLKSHTTATKGHVRLELPDGWNVTPGERPFDIGARDEEQTVTFSVSPPRLPTRASARAVVRIGDRDYATALDIVDHAHIPIQMVLSASEATVVRLDVRNTARRIGYLMGSGDDLPAALRQAGCEVTLIEDDELHALRSSTYDAVIVGIRAFNTRPRLLKQTRTLMDYVKDGGTLLVQYQVGWELDTNRIGPYPFKVTTDRVTDETAGVTFVDKNHPVVTKPNRLTLSDFDGWIQERGLYFASDVDSNYQMIFSMKDPGEEEHYGSLITARYGKGTYYYTGLAFFRQLPAGVPGAYRLLMNLLSSGK